MFIIGTFFPNPYTKHLIKKDIESFYTHWANALGLQEPSFEYTNELAWRHSISYTNDSDVGFINISTYLENIRIRSCFKTPCNDSKNNQALEIDVVE